MFWRSQLSSLNCKSFPGTDNQLGVIKTFNDSSKAPVLGVTAPRYLVYSLHGLMCQRHHPHLSLCQKDGCNAGNGGDMKEVGIPRWSSVEQTVPLCDGFESSTALKCGRIEIYKVKPRIHASYSVRRGTEVSCVQ